MATLLSTIIRRSPTKGATAMSNDSTTDETWTADPHTALADDVEVVIEAADHLAHSWDSIGHRFENATKEQLMQIAKMSR